VRPEILSRAAWNVRQRQQHPAPVTDVPVASVVECTAPSVYDDHVRRTCYVVKSKIRRVAVRIVIFSCVAKTCGFVMF
jgi:hypothetical protein